MHMTSNEHKKVFVGGHLISAIEESGVRFTLHELAQLRPLILRRVNPRGVVGTGVKQEHRSILRCLHVREHTCQNRWVNEETRHTN